MDHVVLKRHLEFHGCSPVLACNGIDVNGLPIPCRHCFMQGVIAGASSSATLLVCEDDLAERLFVRDAGFGRAIFLCRQVSARAASAWLHAFAAIEAAS